MLGAQESQIPSEQLTVESFLSFGDFQVLGRLNTTFVRIHLNKPSDRY